MLWNVKDAIQLLFAVFRAVLCSKHGKNCYIEIIVLYCLAFFFNAVDTEKSKKTLGKGFIDKHAYNTSKIL